MNIEQNWNNTRVLMMFSHFV